MKNFYNILCATCVLFITSASAYALTTIDFEDMAEGTILTDQFSDLGITFSYIGADGGPTLYMRPQNIYPGIDMAFNPAIYTPQEKYLDVQLDFIYKIDYFSIRSIDADESMYLKAYLDDNLVTNVYFPATLQDLGIQTMVLENIGSFNRVVLDINNSMNNWAGPEFFDNVNFSPDYTGQSVPTPEPATMILVGTGLIGLAGIRRKTGRHPGAQNT